MTIIDEFSNLIDEFLSVKNEIEYETLSNKEEPYVFNRVSFIVLDTFKDAFLSQNSVRELFYSRIRYIKDTLSREDNAYGSREYSELKALMAHKKVVFLLMAFL